MTGYDVIADARCADLDATEAPAPIIHSLRRDPAAGIPHAILPCRRSLLVVPCVEVVRAAARQVVLPSSLEFTARLIEAPGCAGDMAVTGVEAAGPAPLLCALRRTGAFADPPDADVAVIDLPAFLVAAFFAAAGEVGHGGEDATRHTTTASRYRLRWMTCWTQRQGLSVGPIGSAPSLDLTRRCDPLGATSPPGAVRARYRQGRRGPTPLRSVRCAARGHYRALVQASLFKRTCAYVASQCPIASALSFDGGNRIGMRCAPPNATPPQLPCKRAHDGSQEPSVAYLLRTVFVRLNTLKTKRQLVVHWTKGHFCRLRPHT